MPCCPPSCPKVKQQLRRLAAEKKKAREARLRPPEEDDEEIVPEYSNVKNHERPRTEDFDSGERLELDSDHDSQERLSEGSGSEESDFERGEKGIGSVGSEGRFSKNSGHHLLARSINDRNDDISKIGNDIFGENSGSVKSDQESRKHLEEDSGVRSFKNSVHYLTERSSKDWNEERRKNRDEPLEESSDLGRSDRESRRSLEEDSGQRSSKNSDHYLSQSSGPDQNEDGRKSRDETLGRSTLEKSSDLDRSDQESRRLLEEDSERKSSKNSGYYLPGSSSTDRNEDNRKNRAEILRESTSERSIDLVRSYQESRGPVKEDSGQTSSQNSGHYLLKSFSNDRNEDISKIGNENLGSKSSDLGRKDEELRRLGNGERSTMNSVHYLLESSGKDPDADRRENRDGSLDSESIDLGRNDEELRRLSYEETFSRNSEHNRPGRSSKDQNVDRSKNRDSSLVSESSDLGRNDGESRRPSNEEGSLKNSSKDQNVDGRKSQYGSLRSERSDLGRRGGGSRRPSNEARSYRNSDNILSGSSGKDHNVDRRKHRDSNLEIESSDLGRRDLESRRPVNRRSWKNSGQSLVGRSSIGRNWDKRENRDGSLRSQRSDFGISDMESRGRGSRVRDEDAKSRRLGKSTGKMRKDSAKAGPSTSSTNEYLSDQDSDPSDDNSSSSECSLPRLKEEMLRRKREAKQKKLDEYLLNKGMNYFQDICNCCSTCLAKQLWNDPFARKIFASAVLFAVGIKLCWEMDAWYIPIR